MDAAVFTGSQCAEPERSEMSTRQSLDAGSHRFEQAADFAIFAFPHGHPEPGKARGVSDFGDRFRADFFGRMADKHSLSYLPNLIFGQGVLQGHFVDPRNSVAGIGESFPESGVVGEYQEPFGILIEASDGKNPLRNSREIIVNRLAPFFVFPGGHASGGLMKEEIHFFLFPGGLAVDPNPVRFPHAGSRIAHDSAVHADTSF
jgi:hypothetical protein